MVRILNLLGIYEKKWKRMNETCNEIWKIKRKYNEMVSYLIIGLEKKERMKERMKERKRGNS